MKPAESDFDWGMHYFRAFAILAIIACHYAAVYGYGKLDKVALTSSTVYFLFISGYLCQYLHDKRPESALVYYRKKLVNVIAPFFVFSLIFGAFKGELAANWGFLAKVLMGRMQLQYWYIPFVSLLFLVSPGICRLGNGALAMLNAVAAVLFLLFPYRIQEFTFEWPEFFYQYTYFGFFYLFGFLYCRHKARFEELIRRYWTAFAGMAAVLLALAWNGGLAGLRFANMAIAVNLQRLMMIFCVLGVLRLIRDRRIWLLDNLAKFSFTLYFIHLGLLFAFEPVRDKIIAVLPLPEELTDLALYAGFTLLILALAMALKKALGKRSRAFIGA